jgi:hypothetical protein
MLAVSTSPRILLEFRNSNREEWLDWNVQFVRSEMKLLRGRERGRLVLLLLLMKMRKSRIAGYAGIFVFLLFGVWSLDGVDHELDLDI